MTVALVLVILHGIFMAAVYWTTRQNVGDSSPVALTLLLLTAAADVIAGFGMWNWKRWGLYLYAAATLVKTIVFLIYTGDLIMIFGGLLPALVVAYILLPRRGDFR